MKRVHWLWGLIAPALAIAFWPTILPPAPRGESEETKACLQAETILHACEAYRDSPANPERGKYPTALAELVNPPFGGPSFLHNGAGDLIDPWGNPYHYEVAKNSDGEIEISVCTVWVGDEGIRLLGAERKADGKIRSFRAGT